MKNRQVYLSQKEPATTEVPKCKKVTDNEEDYLASSKRFTRGRMDAGDCEVRKTDVTVDSDGNLSIYYEYHDHGKVFGDRFELEVAIRARDPESNTIITIETVTFRFEASPGEDDTDGYSSNSNVIKEYFRKITGFNRSLSCTGLT